MTDDRIFPLKHSVTRKIEFLYQDIVKDLKNLVSESNFVFPVDTLHKPAKISKGENYNQYPYMVLDYPRLFSRKDVFAMRTIFWWGHYFSNAFILGGDSLKLYKSRLSEKINFLKTSSWYICVHPTPWKLETHSDNYRELSKIEDNDIKIIIDNKKFLKLAAIYPVSHYEKLRGYTSTFLSGILELLT